MDSPGGRNLIGKVPFKLFDPQRAEPILLSLGDGIRFFGVNNAEFDAITARVAQGELGLAAPEFKHG